MFAVKENVKVKIFVRGRVPIKLHYLVLFMYIHKCIYLHFFKLYYYPQAYEFSSPNEKNKICKWESYNTDEFIYMKEKEEEKKLEYKLEQNVEKYAQQKRLIIKNSLGIIKSIIVIIAINLRK